MPSEPTRTTKPGRLRSISAPTASTLRAPVLADDCQHRTALKLLPIKIRVQISDNTRGRPHLVGFMQTLDHYAGDREAILKTDLLDLSSLSLEAVGSLDPSELEFAPAELHG